MRKNISTKAGWVSTAVENVGVAIIHIAVDARALATVTAVVIARRVAVLDVEVTVTYPLREPGAAGGLGGVG